MIRVYIIISGYVHGVFFRAHIQKLACSLNITGWVKNIPGKVEAVFEGKKTKIDKMLQFCKKGPSGAVVKNVEINYEKYVGEFLSFEIKY